MTMRTNRHPAPGRWAPAAATLLLALAAGGTAAAQEAALPRLAVMDLKDGGSMGPDAQDLTNLGAGLAAMLTTEMMRNPRAVMVERDQIKNLIAEQGLALSGMVDESTAIQVGKLLGVQYLLQGSYTDAFGQLRIDVRVVDVETGRLIEARETTRPRTDVFRMVTELAGEVFRDLRLTPSERLPARKPTPAPAVVLFSQGLGFEDRGDVERAKVMFRRALEIFPEYEEARARLEKLEAGA